MHLRWLAPVLFLFACSSASGGAPGSAAGPAPAPPAPPAPPDGPGAPPAKPAACSQETFDAYVKAVADELTAGKVTGASVAIVCDGKTFSAGIGQTSASNGKPVDAHTRFNVGSTRKAFTAALAMRLVEKGTVALDDAASKWITGINTETPYARSFTFAELLSHTSGFAAVPPDSDQATELEAFLQALGQAPLWSPPGEVFNYNNLGFELAGLVMQRAAGASFASLVEGEVFAPAGMVDARMDPAKVMSEGNYATGYSDGQPVQPTDVVVPAMGPDTGAFASADDLAHFAVALLHDGGAMLKPESVKAMTTPRTPTDEPGSQYGFGMFVADLGGTPMWTHSGENAGYVADLAILPTRGFASAILVASDSADMPNAYADAPQTFTGSPLPPPPADGDFDDAATADHVGTYQSASAGAVTIAKDGNAMKITVGGKTATLTPAWKDTYSFPYAPWGGGDLEINFWRVDGKVKYAVTRAFVAARQ